MTTDVFHINGTIADMYPEHGSFSYFGIVLRDAKDITKRSMRGWLRGAWSQTLSWTVNHSTCPRTPLTRKPKTTKTQPVHRHCTQPPWVTVDTTNLPEATYGPTTIYPEDVRTSSTTSLTFVCRDSSSLGNGRLSLPRETDTMFFHVWVRDSTSCPFPGGPRLPHGPLDRYV